ncbi:para-nitrobenzyl esterase [Lewinella marina]|uniref:Carboxylic ester hydrolase n=1 Tax=Neolewinella marina TaxID=438751 RepID=A0A2G0CI03_9BACT|nr:carboxylesterase family protein [Neolewinella marina]NJB85334.1 para-nitrobenzyl esterase [Neolewinella marina]PHK99550.1 carboxylesterase [Neolewinella marina]
MRTPLNLILLLLILGLGTRVRAQEINFGFPVQTEVANGVLEGHYSTRTGVQRYLGIPFAAPPVGDLRWRPPQPAADWEGVRPAKEFGPRPVQRYIYDDMRFRSPEVSEDCLYLNVWTPAKKGESGLPVLVYFYGGGFSAGSGDEGRYDGERLAQEGVVVVTPNYRLNVFGFLAHPELTAESARGSSGNYGLLDQAAALQWVRDNIAAFGGDPQRITIAGESAGSMSVSLQMVSPLSRDLLAGAVGQSGAAVNPQRPVPPLAEGEEWGKKFLEATGYSAIAELRKAPTRDIYEAYVYGNLGGPPVVVDGHFITEEPTVTFRNRKQAQIPLMAGWTSTERPWGQFPTTPEAYRKMVAEQYPGNADELVKYYPADRPSLSAIELVSDMWIVLGTWNWADLQRRYSDQPVYRYRFDQIRPPLKGETRQQEPPGAAHATDIEYFLDNLELSDQYSWEEDDHAAAATMLTYLANFVKSGNPNGENLPEWPALEEGETPRVMILDADSRAEPFAAEPRYRYLRKMAEGARR